MANPRHVLPTASEARDMAMTHLIIGENLSGDFMRARAEMAQAWLHLADQLEVKYTTIPWDERPPGKEILATLDELGDEMRHQPDSSDPDVGS